MLETTKPTILATVIALVITLMPSAAFAGPADETPGAGFDGAGASAARRRPYRISRRRARTPSRGRRWRWSGGRPCTANTPEPSAPPSAPHST